MADGASRAKRRLTPLTALICCHSAMGSSLECSSLYLPPSHIACLLLGSHLIDASASWLQSQRWSVYCTGRAIGAASVKRARAAAGAPQVIPSPHATGLDQRLQPNAAPSMAADEVSLPQSVECCTAASTLYETSCAPKKFTLCFLTPMLCRR